MSFNIVVTDSFKKQAKGIAKKHPSLRSDLNKLIDSLEKDPTPGRTPGQRLLQGAYGHYFKGKREVRGITCNYLCENY